jgi:hypothetical protein
VAENGITVSNSVFMHEPEFTIKEYPTVENVYGKLSLELALLLSTHIFVGGQALLLTWFWDLTA